MIQATGLTKIYGTRYALRGVNLKAERGEILGVFGPNGAGKSTLVRILAGQAKPTSGSVTICGHPLSSEAAQARACTGVVGHQTYLYDDLTAVENLRFFARMFGLRHSQQTLLERLARVGLRGREHEPVRHFSRGMQQRLALARATLHDPEVLILDEPYTGLDQQATILLDELVQDFSRGGGTVLLVTHDVEHGLNIADRVLLLVSGRVVKEGPAETFSTDAIVATYESDTRTQSA
ncbi:MAG TPA: heme ABC exporter ATP-binding protein CcmA [Bacteroidetes bacterium]|nr:heme ABC exporter ATP-binding protein CcmA [Bacteroidota bacterium]